MPWNEIDRKNWLKAQTLKRSYAKDILPRIESLRSVYHVTQYGALSFDPARYPLFLVEGKKFDPKNRTILVTGGVHGYETSGMLGALSFLERVAKKYEDTFNFICAPCISPWAYETINRWNPHAIDPNRSFCPDSPAEECFSFLKALAPFENKIYAHFDLHETTDTDNTVFRPALEARDGIVIEFSPIPDGFYTVADSENPQPDFQKAIIESVRRVTHIAAADAKGELHGSKIADEGVIHSPVKKLFLCAGVTNAPFTTTTEVYPDSPRMNGEICVEAQLAALAGGLNFLTALLRTPSR